MDVRMRHEIRQRNFLEAISETPADDAADVGGRVIGVRRHVENRRQRAGARRKRDDVVRAHVDRKQADLVPGVDRQAVPDHVAERAGGDVAANEAAARRGGDQRRPVDHRGQAVLAGPQHQLLGDPFRLSIAEIELLHGRVGLALQQPEPGRPAVDEGRRDVVERLGAALRGERDDVAGRRYVGGVKQAVAPDVVDLGAAVVNAPDMLRQPAPRRFVEAETGLPEIA